MSIHSSQAICNHYLLQTQAEVSAAQAQLAQAVQMRAQTEAGLLLLLGRSPREAMQASVMRGTPAKPAVGAKSMQNAHNARRWRICLRHWAVAGSQQPNSC